MALHTKHIDEKKSNEEARPPSFWRSRGGVYLIVALGIAGVLLGYEHRVHILASDWFLWLPLLVCVGMHFFMHGGHGGHGHGDDKS